MAHRGHSGRAIETKFLKGVFSIKYHDLLTVIIFLDVSAITFGVSH